MFCIVIFILNILMHSIISLSYLTIMYVHNMHIVAFFGNAVLHKLMFTYFFTCREDARSKNSGNQLQQQ